MAADAGPPSPSSRRARPTPRSWWRRRSLRLRLTAVTTLAVTAFLLLGGVLLVRGLQSTLLSGLTTTADIRAADIALAARSGPLPDPLPAGTSSTQVQVVDAVGRVLSATAGTSRTQLLGTGPTQRVRGALVTQPRDGGPPLLVVTRPLDGGLVVVGVPFSQVSSSVRALAVGLAIGLPLVVLLQAAATYFAVGRTLGSVARMRRQADAISGSGRRLSEPPADDEVRRLAATLNAMLARLDAAGEQQRRFVADSAHELRSPLTAMRVQLEVALAHPDEEVWAETGPEVLAEVLRLGRLVEDLLALARLDGGSSQRASTVDLRAVVRRALPADPRLVLRAPLPALVHADPDALVRVVRNLVDNALRAARYRVEVEVGTAPGRCRVSVHDDGGGIAAADRERVFDRFTRLSAARDRDSGGSGLGLPIAREIARAHGGDVSFADTDAGALVVLDLPAAGTRSAPR